MLEIGLLLIVVAFGTISLLAVKPALMQNRSKKLAFIPFIVFSAGIAVTYASMNPMMQEVVSTQVAESKKVTNTGTEVKSTPVVNRRDVPIENTPGRQMSRAMEPVRDVATASTTRPLTTKAPKKLPLFKSRPTSLIVPAGRLVEISKVSCDSRIRDNSINRIIKVGESIELQAEAESRRLLSVSLMTGPEAHGADSQKFASDGQFAGGGSPMQSNGSTCDLMYRII